MRPPTRFALPSFVCVSISMLAASAHAQVRPAADIAGARPVLIVLSNSRHAQQFAPLPASPGAAPVPLAVRGFEPVAHEYPLVPGDASLSPDGARLVYHRDRRPYVRELATNAEVPLITGRVRDAVVSFVGFSRDGSRLAYNLAPAMTMDGPEPRLPSPAGLYVATLPSTPLQSPPRGRPAVSIASARVPVAEGPENFFWNTDGASLLARQHIAAFHDNLVQVALDTGAVRELATTEGFDGFAQYHSTDAGVVYAHAETTANRSRGPVSLRFLARTGATLAAPRELARINQINPAPTLSPDGALVAYLDAPARDRAGIYVLRTEPNSTPQLVHRCDDCRFRWEAPSSLLVIDRGALVRVRTTTPPTATTLLSSGVDAVLVGGGF